jgi:hypothetical protein
MKPKRRPFLGMRAIAAVEFAICAPMLLILFMGTIEILVLYRTEAKLDAFAGSFAQMVSLQEIAAVDASGVVETHSPVPTSNSGGTTGLTDLCAGAVDGLEPFPPNGMTLDVASVTETTAAQPASQGVAATPALYDEWEVDMNSACATTGAQAIGTNGANGALTLAVGSGASTSMVQGLGDNIIIVRATLQYPGVLGLILSSAQTLSQTAVARWRYASATNVTNVTTTPAPSSTLEFSCTGTGCVSNYGV